MFRFTEYQNVAYVLCSNRFCAHKPNTFKWSAWKQKELVHTRNGTVYGKLHIPIRIAYKELHSNISVKYRGCDELRIAYGFSWIHSLSVCLSLIFMYFLVSIFSSFDCSV